MSVMRHSPIRADLLLVLHQRLDWLSLKSPERPAQVKSVAKHCGVSIDTAYRLLRNFHKPKAAQHADHGRVRALLKAELENCELITALKLRTISKKNRHLSTRQAIKLIENYGVETPHGLIRAPKGLLSRTICTGHQERLDALMTTEAIDPLVNCVNWFRTSTPNRQKSKPICQSA